jgi:hypothetical protein
MTSGAGECRGNDSTETTGVVPVEAAAKQLLKNRIPQGLKPRKKKEDFIAALKALRHPKANFSPNS